MRFQILDLTSYDEDDGEEEKFHIRLFGRTSDDQTIYVRVDDFQPFFYVKLNDNWNENTVETIVNFLKNSVYPKKYNKGITEYKVLKKYDFYGFTNYKKFKFLRLAFSSRGCK